MSAEKAAHLWVLYFLAWLKFDYGTPRYISGLRHMSALNARIEDAA